MLHYALPAAFALFVWWFSTGLIMFLDGLPRHTFRWSLLGASLLLLASLWGLHASRLDLTVRGAYLAFSCGLLAWGWQEISFYMGFVTGPRSAPCPEGCRGWRHFGHAIQTSLWHELAIIVMAAAVVALTWHAPNQVGTWTFFVLWWMHQSAKLNVFLGVRNLNEEFLPEHLQFLRSFLTRKPMNLLFPVSVTVSTVITAKLVEAAAVAPTQFGAAGFTFLATMMVLAIVEHWLLVLPLPAAALWGWSLKSRGSKARPFDVEVVAGFLGAGKTTRVRHVLSGQPGAGKTIVLVNDFAAAGIDGTLLLEGGSEVVELPNGCICCTLKKDLASQLSLVVARYAPERVLIEPSGVADVASLLAVLSQPDIKPMLRRLRVETLVDAGAFLRDWGRLRGHLEAQLRAATDLVINKADLVTPAVLGAIVETVRGVNPQARVRAAVYGQEAAQLLAAARAGAARVPGALMAGDAADGQRHGHEHGHRHEHGHETAQGQGHGHGQGHGQGHGHEHRHEHGHAHEDGHVHEDALGLASWSAALPAECDAGPLARVLDAAADGRFGAIERVKGIARIDGGWIRFDMAGGRAGMAALAPGEDEKPRVIAIGHDIDERRLLAAFTACGTGLEVAA